MSDKNIDVTERMQKIGETISEYRDKLVSTFKDMEVDVKDWHLKLGVKPKKA